MRRKDTIRRRPLHGFTIVELLVVITIIGLMLGLLLPALQRSREAARQTTCRNNLHNLGVAVSQHLDAQKYFPSGGWGWRWVGDPDRGYDDKQPGGWLYNILPFIEEKPLREFGAGKETPDKRAAGVQVVATIIPLFQCPTRRTAQTYPYIHPRPFFNIDHPPLVARSDYAGNSGDSYYSETEGPATLKEGDTTYDWQPFINKGTGIFGVRSRLQGRHVKGGMSKTFLVGEKLVPRNDYETGANHGDDQTWAVGFDRDVNRWAVNSPEFALRSDMAFDAPNNSVSFGGPHDGGAMFAYCDGSVHTISYEIDLKSFAALANREVGGSADNP